MKVTAADLKVKFASDGTDKMASDVAKMDSAIHAFAEGAAGFSGGVLAAGLYDIYSSGFSGAQAMDELTKAAEAFGAHLRELNAAMHWRCATCKWWDQSTTDRGWCNRIPLVEEFGEQLAEVSVGAYDDWANRCDAPLDGDGNVLEVSAAFSTRSDFGCVQWEAKEG